jgi:hypothetical protein
MNNPSYCASVIIIIIIVIFLLLFLFVFVFSTKKIFNQFLGFSLTFDLFWSPNIMMKPLLPRLDLHRPQSRTESLKADLAKLEVEPAWAKTRGCATVATFQRKGSLDRLEDSKKKWRGFTFVLRDCELLTYTSLYLYLPSTYCECAAFLFSYALQKADFAFSHPRNCISLGGCKV